MNAHDAFLELAAASIDFELSGAERGRLERHLAACAACLREAAALHADARSLASLPAVRLSERRADEILAGALHPGVVRAPLRLLAVAALLGLLLVGSLAIGTELLRRAQQDDLLSVLPVPSTEPSPSAVPSGIPDVVLVVCEADGTTSVTTPVVRAQADGVHITTTNETAEVLVLDVDGIGADNAGPGSTETIWAIEPGVARVACYDSRLGPAPDAAWAQLTVVDPDGTFASTALDCTDLTVGGGSYPAGALGWVGDPVDLTRALLAASHPEYLVEAAGYLVNDTRQVRVRDGERAVARLAWMKAGAGTWLIDSVTTCGGIDLGLDFDALVIASPSPTASTEVEVGTAWDRAVLPDDTVPTTGGGMDGIIGGGPGAIAWGQVYGELSRVWTTTDGRSWERATVEAPADADPDIEMPGFISSITAGGPGYVAVGWYDRAATGRRGVVWTSADGRTWDLVPHDPVFENVLISSVIEWHGELLAYGVRSYGPDEGGGDQLAWASSNGLTWRIVEPSIPAGFRRGEPIVGGDLLWASGEPADGDAIAGWKATRWLTSTDGRAWSVAALPRYPESLYAASGSLLALTLPSWMRPDVKDLPSPGLYRSDDLASWSLVSEGDAPYGELIEVGGTLVVVGDDSDADSRCPDACRPTGWRSVDGGASWQTIAADDVHGTILHVAALHDGTLVGVGQVFDAGSEVGPAAWVSPPS